MWHAARGLDKSRSCFVRMRPRRLRPPGRHDPCPSTMTTWPATLRKASTGASAIACVLKLFSVNQLPIDAYFVVFSTYDEYYWWLTVATRSIGWISDGERRRQRSLPAECRPVRRQTCAPSHDDVKMTQGMLRSKASDGREVNYTFGKKRCREGSVVQDSQGLLFFFCGPRNGERPSRKLTLISVFVRCRIWVPRSLGAAGWWQVGGLGRGVSADLVSLRFAGWALGFGL